MNKSTQKIAAWIACFAILLASLAPSVSHALALAKGGSYSWMEICSTAGAKFVKVTDNQNPTSFPIKKTTTHFEHCPFCLTHAGLDGLPPTATFSLPVIPNSSQHPFLFYQAPYPLFAWTTAQSRAPPLVS